VHTSVLRKGAIDREDQLEPVMTEVLLFAVDWSKGRAFLCSTSRSNENHRKNSRLPQVVSSTVDSGSRPWQHPRAIKGQLQFLSAPDADVTLLFAPRKSIRFR
jgi:hypothetical protein